MTDNALHQWVGQIVLQAVSRATKIQPEDFELITIWGHPLLCLKGQCVFYTAFPKGVKPTKIGTEQAHWWMEVGEVDGITVYHSVPSY